jgi:hypothetical protein
MIQWIHYESIPVASYTYVILPENFYCVPSFARTVSYEYLFQCGWRIQSKRREIVSLSVFLFQAKPVVPIKQF